MELSPAGRALLVVAFVPVGLASLVALGALKVQLARRLGERRAVVAMLCLAASLPAAGITYAVLAGASTTGGFLSTFGGITLGFVAALAAGWGSGAPPERRDGPRRARS